MIIVIFKIYISQATQLRCIVTSLLQNFPQNVPMKKIENRSTFDDDMDNKKAMLSRGNRAMPLQILIDTESAGTLLEQYQSVECSQSVDAPCKRKCLKKQKNS